MWPIPSRRSVFGYWRAGDVGISISGPRVSIFGAIFDPLVHKFHPNTVNLSRGDLRTTWPMDPLYSRLSETHHTWIFPQPFPFINFIQRLISFWLIIRIVGCMYNDADSGYSFFSWGKQELTQKANDMKLFLEIKISPFIYKIFQ